MGAVDGTDEQEAKAFLGAALTLKRSGKDVRAFSAGSTPSGRINPFALDALKESGVDTTGFRSKSWDEFAIADAPRMRIVISACDSAAAETCPLGRLLAVHCPDSSSRPT